MATIETSAIRKANGSRKIVYIAGAVVGLLLVLVLAFVVMMRMMAVPADLDTSTTRTSATGIYRTSIVARPNPVPTNQIHSWTIHVENANGDPVDGATIKVDGDMPQHGHGLPTRPQVTKNLGNGDYLVEGMKFQMGGWWVVDFTITSGDKTDTVRFNMILQ